MKYTTFAAIRKGAFIGAPIIVLVVLIRSCSSCGSNESAVQDTPRTTQDSPRQQLSASSAKPAYGAQELALRDIENEILQLQQEPLSTGKLDDNGSMKRTVRRGSVKLDIRCDKNKGFTTWNRIKVDWDNNSKYDEKWNFRADGSVARYVSPSDDENYSMEYRLYDKVWRLK